jgi:hypothetical protein
MAAALLVDGADRIVEHDRARLAQDLHLGEKHCQREASLLSLTEDTVQRHVRDRLEAE